MSNLTEPWTASSSNSQDNTTNIALNATSISPRDLNNKLGQGGESKEKASTNASRSVFKKLFSCFRSLYSRIDYDTLSEERKRGVDRMWESCLRGVNIIQMQEAVNKIKSGKTEFSRYMPKPAEFKALCVSPFEDRYKTVAESVPLLERLERQVVSSDKQVGKKYLAIMKKCTRDPVFAKEHAIENPCSGWRYCEKDEVFKRHDEE